jgi:hypothetical protein
MKRRIKVSRETNPYDVKALEVLEGVEWRQTRKAVIR